MSAGYSQVAILPQKRRKPVLKGMQYTAGYETTTYYIQVDYNV